MLLTAASLIVIVKPHLPCRYQQSSPIALKLVRVSEHRVHVATYAGLDLRCATDEELQDLELVLRALIGLCVHQDRGRSAVLRDEHRLARECRTFDDARCVLTQIRDGDDSGQSAHGWYLLEYRLWYHQWELPGGAHSVREALDALLESAASACGLPAGQRELRIERPREYGQGARRGVCDALLDAADDALVQARCGGDLLLREVQLAAAVDDLHDQVETVAERVEVGPAGRAFSLGFLLYLVEQVFEVRHVQPPTQRLKYDIKVIVVPALEDPGLRLGAASDTRSGGGALP